MFCGNTIAPVVSHKAEA